VRYWGKHITDVWEERGAGLRLRGGEIAATGRNRRGLHLLGGREETGAGTHQWRGERRGEPSSAFQRSRPNPKEE